MRAPSALATSSTASFAGLVLAVEDRVHLDDVERVEQPGLGDELEREVRLAVGEAAAHRRADAGREHRVDRVEVEADVHERRAARGTSSASRTTRSTPCRSISLIVNTLTSSSLISSRSPGSSERMPTSAARSTDGVG